MKTKFENNTLTIGDYSHSFHNNHKIDISLTEQEIQELSDRNKDMIDTDDKNASYQISILGSAGSVGGTSNDGSCVSIKVFDKSSGKTMEDRISLQGGDLHTLFDFNSNGAFMSTEKILNWLKNK